MSSRLDVKTPNYQECVLHYLVLQVGLETANALLGTEFRSLTLVKEMVPTYLESLSRTIVTGFLNSFIRTGRIQYVLSSPLYMFQHVGWLVERLKSSKSKNDSMNV